MNAIRLTAGSIAAAMRGARARIVSGDPDRECSGVSIDTRTLAPGELFVAIRGERFDGAAFAATAIEKGAAGVVVPRGWEGGRANRPAIIEVDDTTAALQELAASIRQESGTKVVAITGSAGKTTTKELTAELLAVRYRVIRNRGNFNNHIGLPLSLIELRQRPEMAVVELGMSHAGEVSTLVRIAQPDVRVWTNVGDAHLGFFASVDAIADAKAEILEYASASTVLVSNADDPRIVKRTGGFAGRRVTFGIDHDADVKAVEVVDRGVEGTTARVETAVGRVDLTVPLVGRANLSNVLAATAVALDFGVPLAAIAERVAHVTPASHRGEVIRLPDGVTMIDDSYNANPAATARALEVLAHAAASRRIAVLGEMLELGEHAVALHEEVGRAVAAGGPRPIDVLYTVGGAPAEAMAHAAIAAGMARSAVRHFETSQAAAEALIALASRGDLVLVKGSRGVRMDNVVERVKAERG
ncbi:MAG TPA: UDP-N-acetylmuramoyl-tripeptide--D-alanyl-D-alanine ligase [Vicinamibacterales bacterium]|nr:UDP-N-acetylmuramoyl-tripeptide--D-alanyl-D-alanine ligase [Vicinamibacterales bacterium]